MVKKKDEVVDEVDVVEIDDEIAEAMRGREDSRGAADAQRAGGRVPMGGHHSKLDWGDKDPAYKYRWINHDDRRIADALRGGYEPVMQSEAAFNPDDPKSDDWVTRRVGKKESMAPLTAVLMRIKREWYTEDQREKLRPVDETEAIIRGHGDPNGAGKETYSDVKVQDGFRR
jgi:hypothetical protein